MTSPTAPARTSQDWSPRPVAMPGHSRSNALSVDVEEYFQVGAFEHSIGRERWDSFESRVEAATRRLLDLFDAKSAKCTFFTLGWIAERHPELVREIVERGHELASHGYDHARVHSLTPSEFRSDIRHTKAVLEDVSGCRVKGYRAPSFSISEGNLWALEILAEEGFAYSSSIYPIQHDHYGMPDAPRFAFHPFRTSDFIEIPMTTVKAAGRLLPSAGGGYFRLFPYAYSRWAIHRVNRADNEPALFYMHPWEIDPDQPRMDGPLRSRFRHYTKLKDMYDKVSRMLDDFVWDRYDRVFL